LLKCCFLLNFQGNHRYINALQTVVLALEHKMLKNKNVSGEEWTAKN
jgi:hypothetical protein